MTRDKQKAKHKRLAERERLETKKREACLDALMGISKKPEVKINFTFDSKIFNRQVDEALNQIDKFIASNPQIGAMVDTQWFIDQLRKI